MKYVYIEHAFTMVDPRIFTMHPCITCRVPNKRVLRREDKLSAGWICVPRQYEWKPATGLFSGTNGNPRKTEDGISKKKRNLGRWIPLAALLGSDAK